MQSGKHINNDNIADDFAQQKFAVASGQVNDESFPVAIALIDEAKRPVDVTSVGHPVDIGLYRNATERHCLEQLLQPLQAYSHAIEIRYFSTTEAMSSELSVRLILIVCKLVVWWCRPNGSVPNL